MESAETKNVIEFVKAQAAELLQQIRRVDQSGHVPDGYDIQISVARASCVELLQAISSLQSAFNRTG